MLNVETKKILNSARDVLVGKVPDPKAQVEQITFAMFYKFMDEKDKESIQLGGKAQFFVDEFENFSWSKLMDPRLGGIERMDLYTQALAKMSQNPHIAQLFRDVYKDAFIPFRSPETLNLFLKEIERLDYTNTESLGDAFEYLLSIMGSQGDAGQFRTPRHIIDFIVSVVDPQKSDTVLDPACGTAGFLISSFKHIIGQEEPLTPDEKKDLMKNLVGYDISPDMVRLSKVNLYLHSFPNPTIYEYDTLSSEEKWDENFDVILANPPFMSPKGGIKPHKRFAIQANRSEVLFVDYIIEHLKPNGRAGIIIPEGIIFQSANAYVALRKKLVEDGLYSVVSLPAGVFQPYSGVKTSILLFDKEISKRVNHILFVKIHNDGFDLGAQRKPSIYNDFPLAAEALRLYKKHVLSDGKFSIGGWPVGGENIDTFPNLKFISKKEISSNGDYSLAIERYLIGRTRENTKWSMVELSEICSLEYGKPLKAENRKIGEFPVFGSNGIVGYHDNYLVNGPFIIVGRKGSAGSVVFSEKSGFPIDTTFYIKLKDENKTDLKFLYFLLKTLDLKKINTQSGVPGLNRNDAYKIKVPLLPIEVQKEIVEQIEVKQNAIDSAKSLIESLQRERSYFGKSLKRVDIKWIKLEELCEITSSKRIYQNEYVKSGIPFYRSKEIIELSKNMKITKTLFISKSKFNELKKKFGAPKVGDLLITAVGSIGFTYLVQGNSDFYFKDGNLLWLRNVSAKIDRHYLREILAHTLQKSIKNLTNGGAYNALTIEKLKKLEIPIPPLKIQKQMVEETKKEKEIIEVNRNLVEIMEQKIQSKILNIWEQP